MALYTMKEMLADAQKRNYGVGFFNTFNCDMARAIIRAAEECNSPVIIGPAESLLKYGTFDWTMPVLLELLKQEFPELDYKYLESSPVVYIG